LVLEVDRRNGARRSLDPAITDSDTARCLGEG